jgi:transaldolase
MKIKIYADGADYKQMSDLCKNSLIKGFTTNPTLMKKNNIKDYKKFALKVLNKIKHKPISFEVFTDNIMEMEKQAYEIDSWAKNLNIKIPITNTKGNSTAKLIGVLTRKKIFCNVTAIFTVKQIKQVLKFINKKDHIIFSVFAGRIADTGRDPEPIIRECKKILKNYKNAKLLWASTREVFNIIQAERSGCDIITVPNEFIGKIKIFNKSLNNFSLETVKMFYQDALKAGFEI